MKVLIIVDVQNDFCPGGSLAVSDGDKIIPNINKLSESGIFDLIVATQDWHPKGHVSFASRYGVDPFTVNEEAGQMVWPDHCIQGTFGAELRKELDLNNVKFILRKGMKKDVDSYSAFYENDGSPTDLDHLMLDPGNLEIYIVGIATDVCVMFTANDAKKIAGVKGDSVTVISDASAGVTEEGVKKAYEDFKDSKINIKTVEEVLNNS